MSDEKEYEYGVICLNEMGDVIIIWDDEGAAKMAAWVEKMMAEGCQFFILKPRAMGLLKPSRVALKKLSDLTNGTALAISEEVFATLAPTDKSVAVAQRNDGANFDTVAVAETPQEVLKSQTVMTKPRRGG